MAAVMPDRQPSPNTAARNTPGLSINLSSNNPFRNRAVSPAGASPRSLEAPPSRDNRMSRNPFLDASDFTAPPSKEVSGLTADIFNDLSLLDRPANGANAPPTRAPPRAGTMPVNGSRPPAPPGDRRGPPPPPYAAPGSPDKREHPRRPRGLSDSSVMDKERDSRRERERSERTARTESEERRRRERRKEREERHKREKEKVRNGGRMKKPQGLDIIDKLDVTGIYGQGLFHHDGPFDACNPHRNAKKDRRAPMQAFPANSANMALGGSGPLNSRLDLDRFHGRGEEAFESFTATRKAQPNVVDPTARIDMIHAQETDGLGTSTFLEGAPASRRDLQRRDSEEPAFGTSAPSGLGRKKSIAQRFRGMSNTRRQPGSTDFRSPDARYYPTNDTSPPRVGAGSGITQSAGGPSRARFTKENEVNPFENDYEDAYERKGAQIKIAEQEKPLMGRTQVSPRGGGNLGLTRSVTADSAVRPGSGGGNPEVSEGQKSGGGFLSRMKSLKGGRRARPEMRDS